LPSPWLLLGSWQTVYTSTVWTLTYREIRLCPSRRQRKLFLSEIEKHDLSNKKVKTEERPAYGGRSSFDETISILLSKHPNDGILHARG
jgi:hypothetical protein